MKRMILLLLLISPLICCAQLDVHDWSNVKNIPAGSQIWIKGAHGRCTGEFLSADDHEVRVQKLRRSLFGGRYARECRMPRGEVREVRFAKHLASAAAGAAIGGGIGVAAGLAAEAQYPNKTEDGHLLSGTTGLLGALFGGLVGQTTAFIHGAKIYVAP